MKIVGKLILLFLVACSGSSNTAQFSSQPLTMIREWNLVESDSLYLGRAGVMELTPDGSILVSDYSTAAVYEFDKTGHFLRRFGYGRGSGPGEFIGPTGLAVTNDRIAVEDIALMRTSEFSTKDGSLVRSVNHGKRVQMLAYHLDTLYAALMTGVEAETFMQPFSLGSARGQIPTMLTNVSVAANMPSVAINSGAPRTVVMSYEGIDSLYVYESIKSSPHTLPLPRSARPGVSEERWAWINNHTGSADSETDRRCVPSRVRSLNDGSVIVVIRERSTRKLPARLWVSRIASDGTPMYVDLEVPVDKQSERPLVSLSDTSVVILEPLVTQDDKPVTRLREFRLPSQ